MLTKLNPFLIPHTLNTTKNALFIIVTLLVPILMQAQQPVKTDSIQQKYSSEQKKLAQSFSSFFYPNHAAVYSLPEPEFVLRIDSFKNTFNKLLSTYSKYLDQGFVSTQNAEIKYYFDKIILDYPSAYKIYTGKKITLSATISNRLKNNLSDFNKPHLLVNSDFREYVKAYIYHQTSEELQKNKWKTSDNQYLNVAWRVIPALFTNTECRNFWKYDYLYNHIDNIGITNIDKTYHDFLLRCKDSAYVNKIRTMYAEDSAGRKDHLIKTYKTANGFNLNIHIFLPDSISEKKRPAIVFFHGGSWSEGKPDWFFESCKNYARKGWVACAVEYRIVARHNTLPFEAVKDARSAIRWIRQNASTYFIDTNKIVASGNSAGGHLVLATVLANMWNENTDDLRYNAMPDIALVNAGVYDLTSNNTAWISEREKNKNIVKQISPLHLVKKVPANFLIIHGTNDKSCPFPNASAFVEKMKQSGNIIEFHPLEGAGHYIWYDPKYAGNVSTIRSDFLKKLGY